MNLLFVFVPLIAFLYASIGFGGATGYLAIMNLFGINSQVMASTALLLNVIVASISFFTYFSEGHLRHDLLVPFIITSIPAAFIGGSFKLTENTYTALLYAVLTFVAIRLLFFSKKQDEFKAIRPASFWLKALIGLVIGSLSGLVGIGGGIFLSPIILFFGWGNSRQAAAVAAAFIVLNSISGLLGRLIGGTLILDSFSLSLLPFAIIGALAGSWLGAKHFTNLSLRRILGAIMSFAASNFWFTFWR